MINVIKINKIPPKSVLYLSEPQLQTWTEVSDAPLANSSSATVRQVPTAPQL